MIAATMIAMAADATMIAPIAAMMVKMKIRATTMIIAVRSIALIGRTNIEMPIIMTPKSLARRRSLKALQVSVGNADTRQLTCKLAVNSSS